MTNFVCAVADCKSDSRHMQIQGTKIIKGWVRFPPAKHEARRRKMWEESCKRPVGWKATRNHAICSLHFIGWGEDGPTCDHPDPVLFAYNGWGENYLAQIFRKKNTLQNQTDKLPDEPDLVNITSRSPSPHSNGQARHLEEVAEIENVQDWSEDVADQNGEHPPGPVLSFTVPDESYKLDTDHTYACHSQSDRGDVEPSGEGQQTDQHTQQCEKLCHRVSLVTMLRKRHRSLIDSSALIARKKKQARHTVSPKTLMAVLEAQRVRQAAVRASETTEQQEKRLTELRETTSRRASQQAAAASRSASCRREKGLHLTASSEKRLTVLEIRRRRQAAMRAAETPDLREVRRALHRIRVASIRASRQAAAAQSRAACSDITETPTVYIKTDPDDSEHNSCHDNVTLEMEDVKPDIKYEPLDDQEPIVESIIDPLVDPLVDPLAL